MALLGGVLGTDMLREEIAVSRETAARYQRGWTTSARP